ncbi:MAG: glucuronate isomerase [Termitinemataceae bacterium]|nr:MAG: glucuronate isomerase [Termitinemataceae bacterium]
MGKFIDKDFLLFNTTAKRLYHEAAAEEPVFDYHCHLIPSEIAQNIRFDNLSEIWLSADHYKWRAMRANGIAEEFITGAASPEEKFMAWARTVPLLIGNPLYHWTHLELQRYFDFYEPLNEANAKELWQHANKKLKSDDFSVYGIFKKFNVYAVGTTDDPLDSLEFHKQIIKEQKTQTKVLPSFRPDAALELEKEGWFNYIKQIGARTQIEITKFDDLLQALLVTVKYFDDAGCRIADFGLHHPPAPSRNLSWKSWDYAAADVFLKRLQRMPLSMEDQNTYKSFIICVLAEEFKKLGWAMQLHLFPLRAINTSQSAALGPNTGFDAIGDGDVCAPLAKLLDAAESRGGLPKTILYSLNPKDFYPLAAIGGSFQGGGSPGKVQLGSAWWFLDNKDQMEAQLRVYANIGVLPRFIGMLTDSRSFLSFPRHEYFRRILCNLIGKWAEDGEIDPNIELLKGFVRDISFRNAQSYFLK